MKDILESTDNLVLVEGVGSNLWHAIKFGGFVTIASLLANEFLGTNFDPTRSGVGSAFFTFLVNLPQSLQEDVMDNFEDKTLIQLKKEVKDFEEELKTNKSAYSSEEIRYLKKTIEMYHERIEELEKQ